MRPSSTHSIRLPPVDGPPQAACRRSGRQGRRLLAEGGHQLANPVRLLRAHADPVVDAPQVKLELGLTLARDRVEEPDLFETGAALALAAVGHDNVIKGLIPRATARQTNRYHWISAARQAG